MDTWLRTGLTILQVFASLAIIALVLLQRGRGADAGAGFGAGASGTVFGARGATTGLSRATAAFAAVFMLNSLALAWLGTRPAALAEGGLLGTTPAATQQQQQPAPNGATGAPVAPATTVPAPATGSAPIPSSAPPAPTTPAPAMPSGEAAVPAPAGAAPATAPNGAPSGTSPRSTP